MTKTRSPQTIGLDEPGPGSGLFHRTFFVSLQVSGRLVSSLMPDPFGPRKRVQSAEADAAAARQNAAPSNAMVSLIQANLHLVPLPAEDTFAYTPSFSKKNFAYSSTGLRSGKSFRSFNTHSTPSLSSFSFNAKPNFG